MWWRITSVLKGSKGWGKKGYQRGNIYVKMKWQGARVLINVVSLLAAQFNLTSIFDSLFHSRLYVMTYRKKYKNEYLSSYIYLWPTSILKKKRAVQKRIGHMAFEFLSTYPQNSVEIASIEYIILHQSLNFLILNFQLVLHHHSSLITTLLEDSNVSQMREFCI